MQAEALHANQPIVGKGEVLEPKSFTTMAIPPISKDTATIPSAELWAR
jgi:hypothetical protein